MQLFRFFRNIPSKQHYINPYSKYYAIKSAAKTLIGNNWSNLISLTSFAVKTLDFYGWNDWIVYFKFFS